MTIAPRILQVLVLAASAEAAHAQLVLYDDAIGASFEDWSYGGGADFWLWISLAILMLALWLNNTGSSVRPLAATQPSS